MSNNLGLTMKTFSYLLLLIFLISPCLDTYGQKKSKKRKIEPTVITAHVDYWYFCLEQDGSYNDGCVDRVKIKFINWSNYTISKITFILKIECDGEVIYKKKHTLNVDIGPDEVIAYDVKLYGKATAFRGYNYEDFEDFIEILSVE